MAMQGIPDLNALAAYVPPPFGTREHNLGDAWRAIYIDQDDVPEGAPVDYVYALLYSGNKGYVIRPTGTESWGSLEGPAKPGESAEEAVIRVAREQANATIKKVVLGGFLRCRATSHNPDHPVGTIVVRPFALAIASELDDMPPDSGYQRRRLPTNEHIVAIRKHYPEFQKYLGDLSNTYFILAAKGEA